MVRATTEERLLAATIAVLESEGDRAVRVQRIADEVGVAVTSIYHHFGNRRGLIVRAQSERFVRSLADSNLLLAEHLAVARSAAEFREALAGVIALWAGSGRAPLRRRRLQALAGGVSDEVLRASIVEVQNVVRSAGVAVLRPYQERGWIRADLDLEAFYSWGAGVILSKVVLELECRPDLEAGWLDATQRAFLAVLSPA